MHVGIFLGTFPAVVPRCLGGIAKGKEDSHYGGRLEERHQTFLNTYHAGLGALGSRLLTNHFEHTDVKVVVQRLLACLVGKECAQRLHLRRDILLTEEGTQDAFLLKGSLCVPIALHELFDVLVVHTFLHFL